ncbi:hypothetical protein MTO96_050160, partial [Rhipicephalus appendiculatus]
LTEALRVTKVSSTSTSSFQQRMRHECVACDSRKRSRHDTVRQTKRCACNIDLKRATKVKKQPAFYNML